MLDASVDAETSPRDDGDVVADLQTVGRALAASARVAMLGALFDGRPHTAGDLARAAGVASATASEHLAVLLDAGLVAVEQSGRQRWFRLAGAPVAELLEQLGPPVPAPEPSSLTRSREQRRMRAARTCYDHLAGRLGVALTDRLVVRGWLDLDRLTVPPAGVAGLADWFDLDIDALRARRRPLLRVCVDWTERRPHLAGSLGAELAARAVHRGWVARRPGSRGLDVTAEGERTFRRLGVSTDHSEDPG
ncbi:MAG: ArsR/SmtB family transcription factor [Dermatophilaceae bacterium]